MITKSPSGRGQQIDVDVFTDPESGKSYIYWGNSHMAGAELTPDMKSLKEETITVMTPQGGTLQDWQYREAPYVFWRDGKYYFTWSVDDTGSTNYHVAYGTSDNPLGPIEIADPSIAMIQKPSEKMYGTAHNSVLRVPKEWRSRPLVYGVPPHPSRLHQERKPTRHPPRSVHLAHEVQCRRQHHPGESGAEKLMIKIEN